MSKKFTEYSGLDLPKMADEVLDFWNKESIFKKSITSRQGKEPFIFFEGPPSANGMPGIHHMMARTIKDVFCRYKTQKGFLVERKAGWDTHGLPIELGVEKELGITKEDIGKKISVEEYNAACKKAVMRYTDVWNELTEKSGYWVDMKDPYVTYQPKYMETVWWLLKEIYNKDLIYKGYTIQPYSPKAGTGLSSHELNQPGTYQEVTDTTVVAQFKAVADTLPEVIKNITENVSLIAWTTTPWTLPSNTALTVGPKIDYVLVSSHNQYTFEPINVILAKSLVGAQFNGKYEAVESMDEVAAYKEGDKKIPYYVAASFKGTDLEGIYYEQLLPYALPDSHPENAFRVILGDFVTTEDGTGIVHTAPTFGADDAQVAKEAKPEVPPLLVRDENDSLVPLVDLQGRFRPEMKEYAGKYVKNEYYDEGEAPERSVDVELAIQLKEENKAFKVERYAHSYPNCWRTNKPILYYPLDSWFIEVTKFKDRMHDLNKTINWKPKSTGEGRFGNWLANANDWNLSRSRYWGIPLPIWRTEDKTEEIIIGSIEELKQKMAEAVDAGLMEKDIYEDFVVGDFSEENYNTVDLHKNIVDEIVLVSSTGKPMHREPDLIDVWFDSGSMPYAQWHYPFENKEKVENIWRKADFIAEGVDQTRGWFYTLHAIATMIFDDVAYKNVVSNGLVLDKNGQKMSKSQGNAVDPFSILDKYGPDATRWYMISNANPWDNLRFDENGIGEIRNKFFGTLYNTYSFFSLYANIDGFTYDEEDIALASRPEMDRWILSELHSLIQKVDGFYSEYEPTRAARAVGDFVLENLSNWYVRLGRRRFWRGSYAEDKISAYQTLFTCLEVVARLSAPIAPFFSDQLYKDLFGGVNKPAKESVHLSDFPVFDESFIDPILERKMQRAQKITSLVFSLRQKEKIKVRQPLQKIMIPVLNDAMREDINAVKDLIQSEVNVKEVTLIDDNSGILVKQVKPNFKVLGPRFGKEMRFIAQAIAKMDQGAINQAEKDGSIVLDVNGNSETITVAEMEISPKDIEGWQVASYEDITVALDITITPELKNEGIARDVVNRIQNLRKDSGFEVTDRIQVVLQETEDLKVAVTNNIAYIKQETLTDELEFVKELVGGNPLVFDDIASQIKISKNI